MTGGAGKAPTRSYAQVDQTLPAAGHLRRSAPSDFIEFPSTVVHLTPMLGLFIAQHRRPPSTRSTTHRRGRRSGTNQRASSSGGRRRRRGGAAHRCTAEPASRKGTVRYRLRRRAPSALGTRPRPWADGPPAPGAPGINAVRQRRPLGTGKQAVRRSRVGRWYETRTDASSGTDRRSETTELRCRSLSARGARRWVV